MAADYENTFEHEELSLSEQIRADQKTFGDAVQEQLQNTPWWMTSIALHLLAGLIMMFIFTADPPREEDEILIVTPAAPDAPPADKPIERPKMESIQKPTASSVDIGLPTSEDNNDAGTPAETIAVPTPEVDATDTPAPSEDTGMVIEDASAMSGPIAKFSGLGTGGKAFGGLSQRRGRGKKGLLRKWGAPAGTQNAIKAALKWLADHQNEDGSWDTNPGGGGAGGGERGGHIKVAATGFALLAFLGDGNSEKFGKYKNVIKKGLDYFKGIQNNGSLSTNMYAHGIASFAVAEAAAMGGSSDTIKMLREAVDNAASRQHTAGGWGYSGPGFSDTSVAGFMAQSLHSALYDKTLKKDPKINATWQKALEWFTKNARGADGSTGYRGAGGGSIRLRAVGALMEIYGEKGNYEWLEKAVDGLPKTPSLDDMYGTYYQTLVKFQMLGSKNPSKYKAVWDEWNKGLAQPIIDKQEKSGNDKGSWMFSKSYGNTWGRTGDTAISCLCLEVYFRYSINTKGSR